MNVSGLYSIYLCNLRFTLLALYFISVPVSLSYSFHISLILVFLRLYDNKLIMYWPINFEIVLKLLPRLII